jgi:hypothetical protein
VEDTPEPGPLGLPSSVALYPPRPGYVIEGYENYRQFLLGHEEIRTDFARAIKAFVPTDSLVRYWIAHPPQIAYPNKEEPLIQFEFRKFFERGGELDGIRTLTRERMSELQPGEYFFAVGLSGRIRYGYELPREEVDRLEAETGRKVPRANHAYLFPGEPVLTAGAFFVDADGGARIAAVNAQSGHYFYSNVTPSVREDISLRSNGYLLTLAHFFAALEREGIPFDDILVSKL